METRIEWVHIPTNHKTTNRLDMKRYLGGEVAFNKAFKNREIESRLIKK